MAAKVSILKRKGAYWRCGNCMMKQPGIVPQCVFCEIPFSNYETVLIEEYRKEQEDKLKDEKDVYRRS